MANAQANDPTLPTDRIEFLDPIDRIKSADRIEQSCHGSSRTKITDRDLSGAKGAASVSEADAARGSRRRSCGVLVQAPALSKRSLGRQRTRCQTGHGHWLRRSRAL